jgi:hypothetical protein
MIIMFIALSWLVKLSLAPRTHQILLFRKTYSLLLLIGQQAKQHKQARIYGLVIIARVDPHVPIPNTTVKPLSANGTMS